MRVAVYDMDHVRWRSRSVQAEGQVRMGGLHFWHPPTRDQPPLSGLNLQWGDEKTQSTSVHFEFTVEEARELHRRLCGLLGYGAPGDPPDMPEST